MLDVVCQPVTQEIQQLHVQPSFAALETDDEIIDLFAQVAMQDAVMSQLGVMAAAIIASSELK